MSTQILLTSDPEQQFNILLAGVRYEMRVALNYRLGLWSMNLTSSDGTMDVAGIALVSGVDLVNQFPELPFKNLYAFNNVDKLLDPSDTGFSSDSSLVLFTDAEVGVS